MCAVSGSGTGNDLFTTFHAAQASGTDWRMIGQKLREQLPQPCRGGLGLLWGTPPLHDAMPSLTLMLRSVTKVTLWVDMAVDGIMGITPGALGAAALILPYAPPDIVTEGGDSGSGIVLLQHSGSADDAALQKFVTAQDFTLGARFGVPGNGGTNSTIRFAPTIPMISGVTQSCLPIGPTHSVSRARGTHIITVDDKPAQQILRQEVGAAMLQTPADWRDRIFVGLPERGHDQNDYRTIAIAGLEPDGSIILTSPIETGRRILFTARSNAGATHDLRHMLRTMLQRSPTPRAALYFSTSGRQELFQEDGGEQAHLRAALDPKIPCIGLQADAIISGRRSHQDAGLMIFFGA